MRKKKRKYNDNNHHRNDLEDFFFRLPLIEKERQKKKANVETNNGKEKYNYLIQLRKKTQANIRTEYKKKT
jgi:hypothetical protein